MNGLHIRPATMEDTGAISALFRRRINVWQRFDAEGRVDELPYEQLTIYERWLHGGAWMSLETAAIFLSHLLRVGGVTLVAEVDGAVAGYAEAYPGDEPPPYGKHLHIAHLITQAETIKDALLQHLLGMAKPRLTVALSTYDTEAAAFYQRYGMQPIANLRQYTLSARAGQSFYQATEHLPADYAQIAGWHMLLGRLESARAHWELLWPRLWEAFPQITAQKTHRLHFSAAGQEAFVCYRQQLYAPRSVDVYCWSPRPPSKQLLVAISDWAHRENYRSLTLVIPETMTKWLDQELEENPQRQEIYAVEV